MTWSKGGGKGSDGSFSQPWQVWRGSWGQAPWRQPPGQQQGHKGKDKGQSKGTSKSKTTSTFPAYDLATPVVEVVQEIPKQHTDNYISDLQRAINSARKLESQGRKLDVLRQEKARQWRQWQEDLKQSFAREKARFVKDMHKIEQDTIQATEELSKARENLRFVAAGDAQMEPVDAGAAALVEEDFAALLEGGADHGSEEIGGQFGGVKEGHGSSGQEPHATARHSFTSCNSCQAHGSAGHDAVQDKECQSSRPRGAECTWDIHCISRGARGNRPIPCIAYGSDIAYCSRNHQAQGGPCENRAQGRCTSQAAHPPGPDKVLAVAGGEVGGQTHSASATGPGESKCSGGRCCTGSNAIREREQADRDRLNIPARVPVMLLDDDNDSDLAEPDSPAPPEPPDNNQMD